MNSSSSELNFRAKKNMNTITSKTNNTIVNNNNNSSNSSTVNSNQKKLEKHSVSMFQIQQLVEIRSDQQGLINADNLNRKEPLSASTTRRTFIRNTAGSFDLNVNSLNLNESQSNLRIIFEAQQNDFHVFPVQANSQQQTPSPPIDSAMSGSGSALATSALNASSSVILPKTSKSNRRFTTSSSIASEFLLKNEKWNYNEVKKNRSESATAAPGHDDREISSTCSYSDSIMNDDEKIVNIKNLAALPFNNEVSLNNNNNKHLETIDSNDLFFNESSDYVTSGKESNSFTHDASNKNVKIKKQKKTSAFAWVGRTVGK